MRNTTYNSALINQPAFRNSENLDRATYQTSILFAVGGGLVFGLLGFLLIIFFTVFDRNNAALNYAGVSSLIFAFIFFGIGAHFMDKSDEIKRRQKKSRMEEFNRKRF